MTKSNKDEYIKRNDVLALVESGALISNSNYKKVCKLINDIPAEDESVCGWTNGETYAVVSIIDNDDALYNEVHDIVDTYKDEGEDAVYDIASEIEDLVEIITGNVLANSSVNSGYNAYGLAAELMDCALSRVQFHEIAESYLDEMGGDNE